ncbi:hypothetical protein [Rubrivivax sp. A210]|uniref:hypothetical protein n=1 Tax=Rubrivivax sp. A210 TaxID=2772301 RepID=UPI00191901E7|nr:hypothetical protein [Rubrivivax sp. A210]
MKQFYYHDAYTRADDEAGWVQVEAFRAEGVSEAEIEEHKAAALSSHRTYWLNLLACQDGHSVISKGKHFVRHDLGVDWGFGGTVFRVDWIDPRRPPLTCNLTGQGRIPGWLRPQYPDNATITDLGYLLDERPVMSRTRLRRRLRAAGARAAEVNAFLRDRYTPGQPSFFDYWPSRGLHELMRHGKRHAHRWFPNNILIAG